MFEQSVQSLVEQDPHTTSAPRALHHISRDDLLHAPKYAYACVFIGRAPKSQDQGRDLKSASSEINLSFSLQLTIPKVVFLIDQCLIFSQLTLRYWMIKITKLSPVDFRITVFVYSIKSSLGETLFFVPIL